MVLEAHRQVWPNDDVVEAEGATPDAQSTVLPAGPALVLMSGFRGLPQGALSLLLARLAQARRDLGESPCSSALTGHTHSPPGWQDVDRKGPWQLAGRSDSERGEGHGGGGDIFLQSRWT